jgi:superfamily I DNA and/or RNA helicase
LDPHFENLLRLVELEARAQAERAKETIGRLTASEAEASGVSLLDLVIADREAGPFGRIVVELKKRTAGLDLPWTQIGAGSPVMLSAPEAAPLRGVAVHRSRSSIRIALASIDDESEGPFRVDLSRDEITTEREKRALRQLGESPSASARALIEAFAGGEGDAIEHDASIDSSLDGSQRAAVDFALSSQVALIHGPPGTGKTRTLVELIRCAAALGQKVLACAPSNTAVDNLLERLTSIGLETVRLGHYARVAPEVVERTLDALVERSEDVRRARKLVKEAWALRRNAERWTRAKPPPSHKRELREEARRLFEDARRLETEAAERILDKADVVCATTSLDADVLRSRRFDVVVIDEACQCTEPSAWIPILRGDRVVLAGDHCQLPPTILSREAEEGGLGRSLFERVMGAAGDRVSRRLDVQYRMHEDIMGFSNAWFYGGTLIADASVKTHRLSDLGIDGLDAPIAFIDTAGAGYGESVEPDGESRMNAEEARLVASLVAELRAAGVAGEMIGVITPYAAQTRLLRTLLEGVEIDTVDGFQGREKEVIVISLVRSNDDGAIGFLSDLRRMNVALTRARRKLYVVGDSATISGHAMYRAMIEYFESRGGYSTVWDQRR